MTGGGLAGGEGHFYCAVCKSNLRDGPGARRRHMSGREHCSALEGFLASFTAEVKERHRGMREVREHGACAAPDGAEWQCPLCDAFVATRRSPFHGHAVYQHLAGKKHALAVDSFVSTYLSADLRQRCKKKHLRLTQGAFSKYVEREAVYQPPQACAVLDLRAFPGRAPMPAVAEATAATAPPVPSGSGTASESSVSSVSPGPAAYPVPHVPMGVVAGGRIGDPRAEGPTAVTGAQMAPWKEVDRSVFRGVREEIVALVAKANLISQRKKAKKATRHKRTSDGPVPSSRYVPNFGGVWVSGPRSQSMAQFKQRRLQ
mmetsp:Transcript_16102/g.62803  ORF Transcript_16102/g.62803 Transcript_16102/m.62803 type:complete len:316 (+) Transcript_16102:20-967(+)